MVGDICSGIDYEEATFSKLLGCNICKREFFDVLKAGVKVDKNSVIICPECFEDIEKGPGGIEAILKQARENGWKGGTNYRPENIDLR